MISVIRDLAEFRALEKDWNALAGRFPDPLVQHEWLLAGAEAQGGESEIAVFVLRSRDTIQAAAPLMSVRSAGITTYQYIGHWLGEPTSLLYDSMDSLRALLAGLQACGRPVVLNRQRVDGPEAQLWRRPLLRRSLRMDWDSGPSSWVPLSGGWAAVEAAMSSGSRSYIRRKRKRAEQLGKVEFRAFSPTEETVDPLLQEVFRVEAAGWKGRNGTAILMDPRMERFCLAYGRAAARLGILRIFLLTIGGETAAVRLAVEHSGRIWELKIGYDERWHQCSPGLLLTHETLRHACERDLEAHEFLGHHAPWQEHWACRTHHYSTVRTYPVPTLAGSVALARDVGYFASKQMYQRLRLKQLRLMVRKAINVRARSASTGTTTESSAPKRAA
jgi:CelD/BcsL family acetyltransferase involved in cellulose biosynthesis